MVTKLPSIYCVLLAAALVAVGCNNSEPTSQTPAPPPPQQPLAETTPKVQQPQVPAMPPGHPNIGGGMSAQGLPAGAAADAPNPQWSVPKDWQVGPASAMRRATFVVAGADDQSAEVAISVFPGSVGGLAANINRWRGQIGLAPVAPDEISGMTTDLMVGETKATVVDFKADSAVQDRKQPMRVIVVTVPQAGNSWFFKMAGDAPLLEAQKAAFLQFVQSVKF